MLDTTTLLTHPGVRRIKETQFYDTNINKQQSDEKSFLSKPVPLDEFRSVRNDQAKEKDQSPPQRGIAHVAKTIFQKPLQTLGTLALSAATISLLPVSGAIAATGAAIMTLGFAAFGFGKDQTTDTINTLEKKIDDLKQKLAATEKETAIPQQPKNVSQNNMEKPQSNEVSSTKQPAIPTEYSNIERNKAVQTQPDFKPIPSITQHPEIPFRGVTTEVELEPGYNDEQPVKFSEGLGLFLKGYLNSLSSFVMTPFRHPIKTALTIGATSAGLAMLPLVGIPMATGAAALALGITAVNGLKAAFHLGKAASDNNHHHYNQLRQELPTLGKDAFRLTLSLPFLPKSLKQVKKQAKGLSGIKFNRPVWKSLVKTPGLENKLKILVQQDKLLSQRLNALH